MVNLPKYWSGALVWQSPNYTIIELKLSPGCTCPHRKASVDPYVKPDTQDLRPEVCVPPSPRYSKYPRPLFCSWAILAGMRLRCQEAEGGAKAITSGHVPVVGKMVQRNAHGWQTAQSHPEGKTTVDSKIPNHSLLQVLCRGSRNSGTTYVCIVSTGATLGVASRLGGET